MGEDERPPGVPPATFAGSFDVTGVALVTGAGSGIGRAAARSLAAAGATVAVADIDVRAGRETSAELRALGHVSAFFEVDLADMAAVEAVLEEVTRSLGPVDMLVNAAGIASVVGLMEVDDGAWERVFDVNVKGLWKLSQMVARQLIGRGAEGRIVNLCSSSAFRALGASGAYGVSKAAVAGLTRGLAGELGPHRINVNAVAPGLTATAMAEQFIGDRDAIQARTETGPQANLFHRISEPEDVANAVLFLCSPASRQITGQIVHTSAGAVV